MALKYFIMALLIRPSLPTTTWSTSPIVPGELRADSLFWKVHYVLFFQVPLKPRTTPIVGSLFCFNLLLLGNLLAQSDLLKIVGWYAKGSGGLEVTFHLYQQAKRLRTKAFWFYRFHDRSSERVRGQSKINFLKRASSNLRIWSLFLTNQWEASIRPNPGLSLVEHIFFSK